MVLPIAYLAPRDWYSAYMRNPEAVEIEAMESFEKQTYRNRCSIVRPSAGSELRQPSDRIVLTVPVKKVEHKQLTRDIEISYQSRWQHQHWISLTSAYRHTPYFDYYADYLRPMYERETKWLWDFNSRLHEIIMALLNAQCPLVESRKTASLKDKSPFAYRATTEWRGEELNRWFGDGKSILDELFEFGNETKYRLE